MRLAVFDLDGTLTRHDTLVPYLLGFLRRHPGRLWRLVFVPPAVAVFLLDGGDRGRLKSALLRRILGGVPRAQLDSWTEQFVADVVASGLCPGGTRRLAAHRSAGDHLVLLSASPDIYVPQIARRLGFAEAVCTGVRWDGERLEGSLTTENRRGEEKLRCIEALRRAHPGLACSAYGNSASDLPHLRVVEHGVFVNGGTGGRRAAAALGLPCERWC